MNNSQREKSEQGATAVEYGLLVALIAAVIITVLLTLAPSCCPAWRRSSPASERRPLPHKNSSGGRSGLGSAGPTPPHHDPLSGSERLRSTHL